jgi:hypothetical protein
VAGLATILQQILPRQTLKDQAVNSRVFMKFLYVSRRTVLVLIESPENPISGRKKRRKRG